MELSYSNRLKLMGGAAVVALALGMGTQVFAAEAATDVDAVVVTGFRKAVADAIALKRNNENIIEAVSAEEIGKLPDVSIAESLGRLPGLAAQRLDGRAQVISVRGLAPDFTNTLLNGREAVSTGDNRSAEFDQFPSELINSAVVYKTPDASLIGAGLAGTVDLQTIRPLAYGKRALAIGARYEKNDLGALNAGSSAEGNRLSISYVDQFMDGKLGVALGFAHMESPSQNEKYNSWGYPTFSGTQNGQPVSAILLGGAKPYVESNNLTRDGFMGSIEFKPSSNLTTSLDVFISKFDNDQILRGIELPLAWGGGVSLTNPTLQNGTVVAGTFNGVRGVIRNDENKRHDTIQSFGWNTKWTINDHWSAVADIAYSEVDRNDQLLETYSTATGRSGSANPTDSLTFQFTGKGAVFSSILNYADPTVVRLGNPQGWGAGANGLTTIAGGQDGYLNAPHVKDELTTAKFSLKRDLKFGPIANVEFGMNYSERSKDKHEAEWFLGLKDNSTTTTDAIPSQFLVGTTSLAYLGIKGMVSFDPLKTVFGSGLYNFYANNGSDVTTKSWVVKEDVVTLFTKFGIETDLLNMPVSGNAGLQIVDTDQSSNGFATGAANALIHSHGGAKYTEALPSLNLTWHFPENQVLRFSAARTMARARMDQMSASRTWGFNLAKAGVSDPSNGPWSGGGGNPALRPWIADAYDLSYEHYFTKQGYFAVAVFDKELETYVTDGHALADFTGFPTAGLTGAPATYQGVISAPVNGNGGNIHGLELSAAAPLEIVSPILKGFGVTASYSYTDSSIKPNANSGAIPLPGLSHVVANFTAYYEKDGFSARISDRVRSKFLGEVAGFGNGREYYVIRGESVLDAQIGYSFSNGPLKGMSLLLQVNNLNDEDFKSYTSNNPTSYDPRQVRDYQHYGRTYLLGMNWKM